MPLRGSFLFTSLCILRLFFFKVIFLVPLREKTGTLKTVDCDEAHIQGPEFHCDFLLDFVTELRIVRLY